MRKKFNVYYPVDYWDEEIAGTKYKPPANNMVVMNSSGIFFLFSGERYYPSIRKLSDVLPKYDIKWE